MFNLATVQFHLQGVSNCNEWDDETGTAFVDQLLEYIRGRCECEFSSAHIYQPRYICFNGTPDHVTFRASLVAHQNWNTTQLVTFLEDWQATHGTVVIQGDTLTVTREECPVDIFVLDEPECFVHTPQIPTASTQMTTRTPNNITPTYTSFSKPALVLGGVIAAICTAAIFTIIMVTIFCLLLYKRCKRYSGTCS